MAASILHLSAAAAILVVERLVENRESRIMANVKVIPSEQFPRQFIPAEYLPPDRDEFYLRNEQLGRQAAWRHLRADEIETLVKNANTCDNWDLFLVADPFDAGLVRGSEFSGLVRIARLEPVMLEHHDMQMPAGITNSMVISCDVGENAAIHNVRYLAHYIVGDNAMLLNISEMHTTNHAKFGNCIVKDGEPEEVRVWLDLVNETGTRAVMAFDGMIAADAYIWSRYRDDEALQRKLGEITQRQFDSRRGFYGTVGAGCVVKNCQILKDVKIGPACYVKGANKLKNLTINSTDDEPTQIGEGVEMINGIVGLGCHVFYGCKAVRFVMGNNSNLKYGARLIHSYLGDNSTVSCCELLNNLIFPAHEQHHNNSFLVASLLLGQSNLAAGATIGSNHNSRANDGEIVAGRGFWPGLCTTLKHSCRFASFALLVKGDYPAELNVPLPFSLLDDDRANDRLLVIPAYWWRYNMYALAQTPGNSPAATAAKQEPSTSSSTASPRIRSRKSSSPCDCSKFGRARRRCGQTEKQGTVPIFAGAAAKPWSAKMGLSPSTPPLGKPNWPPSADPCSPLPQPPRPIRKSSAKTWKPRSGRWSF